MTGATQSATASRWVAEARRPSTLLDCLEAASGGGCRAACRCHPSRFRFSVFDISRVLTRLRGWSDFSNSRKLRRARQFRLPLLLHHCDHIVALQGAHGAGLSGLHGAAPSPSGVQGRKSRNNCWRSKGPQGQFQGRHFWNNCWRSKVLRRSSFQCSRRASPAATASPTAACCPRLRSQIAFLCFLDLQALSPTATRCPEPDGNTWPPPPPHQPSLRLTAVPVRRSFDRSIEDEVKPSISSSGAGPGQRVQPRSNRTLVPARGDRTSETSRARRFRRRLPATAPPPRCDRATSERLASACLALRGSHFAPWFPCVLVCMYAFMHVCMYACVHVCMFVIRACS